MSATHDENDVRHALGSLVSDEPPMALGVDAAVTQGRRIRRRRRATRVALPIAGIALVAAAGGAAAYVAATGGGAETITPVQAAAAALPLTAQGRASLATEGSTVSGTHGRALLAAVRDASPSGWTFALDQTDIGVPTLDGSVDDGAGPGRLLVSVTNTKGMYTVHPCGDSDFVAGATCTEKTLPDGTYLNLRGMDDYKGMHTIIVSITREDGTGVSAEASNFTVPSFPKGTRLVAADKKEFSLGGKYGPAITRDLPTYDTAELTAVVKAVANVSTGWPTATMDRG